MSWMQIRNNQQYKTNEISFLDPSAYYSLASDGMAGGYRMIGLFPPDKRKPEQIIAIFADAVSASLYIIGAEFPEKRYESLAQQYPHTNYFECELAESFGYELISHPWIRPVRNQNVIYGKVPYEFYRIEGDEVHEVAVGPIHAGVIEPGHFRFQCHGETVYHLEINLGYQYRGIEDLLLNSRPAKRLILSESVAGDTTIGHCYAHCASIEALGNIQVSLRAQVIRSVAEELERVAMHLTGLGGIANDVGFAIVASSYGRLRTLVINSLAELCGSRFGRGLFTYGGVRFDFNDSVQTKVLNNLQKVQNDIAAINEYMFTSTGALGRFDGTGTVNKEQAEKIGLVGLAARACGVETDTRIHNPYGAYLYYPVSLITLPTGDVFARARLRALEIEESLRFLIEQIQNLPEGKIRAEQQSLLARAGVVSLTEGWRGEIVHCSFTDETGNLCQYKIKDPSFNNWYGLALALRRTAISDFPLCNKSFDLSYAGHDL